MTTYTFKPKASSQFVDWYDPAIWAGGVVPNAPDADVNFPTVTYGSGLTGGTYTSYVQIFTGDNLSVRSVQLRDYLLVNGSLNVSGELVQHESGEIDLMGGAVTAGSLVNNAYDVQGFGTLNIGSLINNQLIIASGGLTINADSITNVGTLAAGSGTLVVNVKPGSLTSADGSTLLQGTLKALSSGTVSLNAGGLITNDAGSIILSGGIITSRDSASGRDIPITSSLNSVTEGGSLTIEDRYNFGPLHVAGNVYLAKAGNLSSSALLIDPTGHLQGSGIVSSRIDNDGAILASAGGVLSLQGSVDGAGTLAIAPGEIIPVWRNSVNYKVGVLRIGGATSQDVTFQNDLGVLQLDHPETYKGAISPTGSGDLITLKNISLESITGVAYTGDAFGGTLSLARAGGSVSLRFHGSYTASNFTLTPLPGYLSSDPSDLQITIKGPDRIDGRGDRTSQADFDGDGRSDILWRNLDGSVSTWSVTGGKHGDQLHQSVFNASVGTDWKIVETMDYNGDGRSDILWRHTNGSLSIWSATGTGGLQQGSYNGRVGTEWTISAVGDFNGDGKDDLLWHHDNGSVSIWSSTGGSFQQNTYSHTPISTDWKIEGSADFNGDGKGDVLWRNDSGELSVWTSTGSGFAEATFSAKVGRDWHIAGLADFDGDGKADILWRHDNGSVSVWSSNGSGFDQATYNTKIGTDWTIAGTPDFNGDGRADILWRNANGALSTWESNGHSFDQSVANAQVATDWSLNGHYGFF